jgi:hypothetical protein
MPTGVKAIAAGLAAALTALLGNDGGMVRTMRLIWLEGRCSMPNGMRTRNVAPAPEVTCWSIARSTSTRKMQSGGAGERTMAQLAFNRHRPAVQTHKLEDHRKTCALC